MPKIENSYLIILITFGIFRNNIYFKAKEINIIIL